VPKKFNPLTNVSGKKSSKKQEGTVITFSALTENRKKRRVPQQQDKRKKVSKRRARMRRSKNFAKRIILMAPKSIRTRAECWETHLRTTKNDWIQCLKCSRWLYKNCSLYGGKCSGCRRQAVRENSKPKLTQQTPTAEAVFAILLVFLFALFN
jgi:hypothetical protein